MAGKNAVHRIEVFVRRELKDALGEGLAHDARDLGVTGIEDIRAIQVYEIRGALSGKEVRRAAAELLADPVSQEFHVGEYTPADARDGWIVDVGYNPGVTDAVGASALKGLRDTGVRGAESVRTSMRYALTGKLTRREVDEVCRRLLANTVIQTYGMKQV